jgi:hypothetical protein
VDATVIAALIGLTGTTTTPLITHLVGSANRSRAFRPPDEARRKAMRGVWVGAGHQEDGPGNKPIDFHAKFELDWRGKVVEGKYTFSFLRPGSMNPVMESLPLAGGFLYDRFLKLDYYDNASGKVQFGALMLELDLSGAALSGIEVGFGYVGRRMAIATLALQKEP